MSDKEIFRKACLKKLRRKSGAGAKVRDRLVLRKVEYFIRKYNPKSILLYLPMGHEVDVRPLFRNLRSRMRVYVPFMEGKSFKLVQYRLPLRRRRFGILEPMNSHFYLSDIEMAVVPVVGVDGHCRRIGFGKGMYDRFFESLAKKPVTLFVQRTRCLTKRPITDTYDVMADIYLTPEETYIRGKHHVDGTFYRRCGGRG